MRRPSERVIAFRESPAIDISKFDDDFSFIGESLVV